MQQKETNNCKTLQKAVCGGGRFSRPRILATFTLVFFTILFAGCSGNGSNGTPQIANTEITLEQYQQERDYEKILALADSLESNGVMTDVQANYWRGESQLIKGDRPEALRFFQMALNGDIQHRENYHAYYMAASAASDMLLSWRNDAQGALEKAMPAVKTMEARGHTGEPDYSDMLYTIGLSQLLLNMFDEGGKTLTRAMDIFDRLAENDTIGNVAYNRIVMLINIVIPYLGKSHFEEADYWLNRSKKALEQYAALPIADSQRVDRSRGRILIYSAEINERLGHSEKAAKAYEEAMNTDFGKTTDGRIDATAYLQAAGRWDEAADIFQPLDSIMHAWHIRPTLGTLSGLMLAKYRSNVGAGRRDSAAAISAQICDFLDSAVVWERKSKAAELATIYQLKEEQLARQQAEADAYILRIITIAVVIALIAVMAFAVYVFHQRRVTAEKNKALVLLIDNSMKTSTAATGVKKTTDPSLFERFTALVHEKQLFRDVNIDRDAVCQQLDIERHALNQLLNDYAGGLSLPAYLNNLRLDAAYDMLHNQTDKSIADIASAVGFTPQNLRLQFKKRYGLTPSEYRQCI